MRIREITIYELEIPFAETFAHGTKERHASDAVILRVQADDGVVGYGEGLARPYVTGETVESIRRRICEVLWPAIREATLPAPGPRDLLHAIVDALPAPGPSVGESDVVAHHGAHCAMELALADCILRRAGLSLAAALPPGGRPLSYSGVLGMTGVPASVAAAERIKALGLKECKVKVGDDASVERVAAVRRTLGDDVSIRVDANGVWDLERATSQIAAMEPFRIESCEEPMGRGRLADLPALAQAVSTLIVLDESLVTQDDARALACIGGNLRFNLRVNKCGGLERCLALARLARDSGIGFSIGSQVGETSILSAAGRHLAAHLGDHVHLEGSFGTYLLAEDVASPGLRFGPGGAAPLLDRPGLGVDVLEERLERYARHREVLD